MMDEFMILLIFLAVVVMIITGLVLYSDWKEKRTKNSHQ